MGERGPKKKYTGQLYTTIEEEYVEAVEKVADNRDMTKSQVVRRLIKENLGDFVDTEDDQLTLTEDLKQDGI